MKLIFVSILIFSGVISFSQKLDSVQQSNILTFLDTVRNTQMIVDTCDKYLAIDSLDNDFRANLLVNRAMIFRRLLNRKMDCDSAREIKNKLFDEAITICTECKVDFIKKKQNTLYCDKYYRNSPGMEDSILISYGYRHDVLSPVISPQYFYGKNQWLGVEVSLLNAFQPFYKVKDSCNGKLITYYDENMIAASLFSLGFRKNISNQKGWGMNLSLLSFSAYWINIRPFNITYLNNGDEGSFGYSPELGFQFWYLHLNAGYNFAIKKNRREYEKFYFTAKFDIPLFRNSRF